MEAKFVVFGTEQELRKHKMSEHKAELVEGLSRHERRAALTIPINLNVDQPPPAPHLTLLTCPGRRSILPGL